MARWFRAIAIFVAMIFLGRQQGVIQFHRGQFVRGGVHGLHRFFHALHEAFDVGVAVELARALGCQHHQQVACQRGMFERPARDVEARAGPHRSPSRRRPGTSRTRRRR